VDEAITKTIHNGNNKTHLKASTIAEITTIIMARWVTQRVWDKGNTQAQDTAAIRTRQLISII
jgi:hypothetical protein